MDDPEALPVRDITCVVMSYGYGHLAAHCLETVIGQTVPFGHVLFVDDGGGDCRHILGLYPGVECILRKKNMGIVKGFNDVLGRVSTTRTMFLGADNWIRPDLVEKTGGQEEIVTYDIMVTGELGHIMKQFCCNNPFTPTPNGYYWSREGGHHGSMVYNTAMALSGGGYRERPTGCSSLEDKDLWTDMLKAGARVRYVREPLLFYRRHRHNFNNRFQKAYNAQ